MHICAFLQNPCIVYSAVATLSGLHDLRQIGTIYGFYVVLACSEHCSYMAHTWLLYVSYMFFFKIHRGFFYCSIIVLELFLHGFFSCMVHGFRMVLVWFSHGSSMLFK